MGNIDNKLNELIKVSNDVKKVIEKFDDPYWGFFSIAEKIGRTEIRKLAPFEAIAEDNEPVNVYIIIGELDEDSSDVNISISVTEDDVVNVLILNDTVTDIIDSRTKFTDNGDDTVSYFSKDSGNDVIIVIDEDYVMNAIKSMKELLKVVKSN